MNPQRNCIHVPALHGLASVFYFLVSIIGNDDSKAFCLSLHLANLNLHVE